MKINDDNCSTRPKISLSDMKQGDVFVSSDNRHLVPYMLIYNKPGRWRYVCLETGSTWAGDKRGTSPSAPWRHKNKVLLDAELVVAK